MTPNTLLWPILLPALAAVLCLAVPKGVKLVREAIALVAALGVLYLAIKLFGVRTLELRLPWLGNGVDFDLRLFHFSSFILLALAGFLVLIVLYSTAKMKDHPHVRGYYVYVLISAALANGAVLADNFVPLVFFWEGLLVTLYLLISIGGKLSHRTAVKAFIISGLCDFCMILGIGILWSLTGSLTLSQISVKPEGLAVLAFVMMMIGAIGKAGAMPFHTWIPDAAIDAPLTFMAFLPAAFEKLLGIYLLARITLDLFKLEKGSRPVAPHDDRRRGHDRPRRHDGPHPEGLQAAALLPRRQPGRLHDPGHRHGHPDRHRRRDLPHDQPRHVQVRAVPERRLGRAPGRDDRAQEARRAGPRDALDRRRLLGLRPGHLGRLAAQRLRLEGDGLPRARSNPATSIFAIAAWVGAIFTFASFLKAGHSVFFGPRTTEVPKVKESPAAIVLPILILAGLCLTFGVFNKLPLVNLIQPILAGHVEAGESIDFTAHALSLFNPMRRDLDPLPGPGLPAPPLRLGARREEGLSGVRARPQVPRPQDHLRPGREPDLRPVRAGRRVPARLLHGPVQGGRPADRLLLRVGRDQGRRGVHRALPQGPHRALRQLPRLVPRRPGRDRGRDQHPGQVMKREEAP